MKGKYLIVILVMFVSFLPVKADTIEYPYDEMLIKNIFSFSVLQEIPESNGSSFLLDIVSEDDPYIEIKVANFDLFIDGNPTITDESIIIISGVNGTIRFLENGYSLRDIIEEGNVIGFTQEYHFWNHKVLTETEVIKNFDIDKKEIYITYNSVEETYILTSYDEVVSVSTTSEYVEGSYMEVTNDYQIIFNKEED